MADAKLFHAQVERLGAAVTQTHQGLAETVDVLINKVEACLAAARHSSDNPANNLAAINKAVRLAMKPDASKVVRKHHNFLNSAIAKTSRSIDAQLEIDTSKVEFDLQGVPGATNALLTAVALHQYQTGNTQAADELVKARGLTLPRLPSRENLIHCKRVCDALNTGSVHELQEWVKTHRVLLDAHTSELPFMIHKYLFLCKAFPGVGRSGNQTRGGGKVKQKQTFVESQLSPKLKENTLQESDGYEHNASSSSTSNSRESNNKSNLGVWKKAGNSGENSEQQPEWMAPCHDALMYARSIFAPFSVTHAEEIQQLMGSLLCVGSSVDISNSNKTNNKCKPKAKNNSLNISNDESDMTDDVNAKDEANELSARFPYRHLFESCSLEALQELFSAESTRIMGVPRQSMLECCLDAGALVLPKILALYEKMANSKRPPPSLHECAELPFELDLPSSLNFHSVFVCPISREPSTTENPPMLLKCGHVISFVSMQRVARSNGLLKCPTCPSVSKTADCVRLVL